MRNRFCFLMVGVACVVAVAGCGGGTEAPLGPVGAPATEAPVSKGAWVDAPGKVQIYNYLVDRGEEITVDLYWFAEEIVDGYKTLQHAEKFATLAYGDQTDVMTSRYFGAAGAKPDELQYVAVPAGTQVAEQAERVLGDVEPLLQMDLYDFNSEPTTAYLNDGGTVVVFLSPATQGSIEAQPRIQSFYADLYPDGNVKTPAPESELPKAGPGEVVLPSGFLFGTESRTESGRLANLMDWRFAADGSCLPEEGNHGYGGDGADWLWVVPETAEIAIHPDFQLSECSEPAWQDPRSLQGIERPFALIVPTAAGEPKLEIVEIPE